MAYNKQTWQNGQAGGTPLNATRLNYIEQGIKDISDEVAGSGAPIGILTIDLSSEPGDWVSVDFSDITNDISLVYIIPNTSVSVMLEGDNWPDFTERGPLYICITSTSSGAGFYTTPECPKIQPEKWFLVVNGGNNGPRAGTILSPSMPSVSPLNVESAASSYTLSAGPADTHIITLTGNITLTMGSSDPTQAVSVSVCFVQDATGGRTITWPEEVKWPGGTEPTLSTAPNARDWFTFLTVNGGITWDGFVAGLGMA